MKMFNAMFGLGGMFGYHQRSQVAKNSTETTHDTDVDKLEALANICTCSTCIIRVEIKIVKYLHNFNYVD
jgi:hypothetical protein